MMQHGAIRPSSSPWASPIVLVKKKDGSTRFCVDYRRLNDITVKDVFPLPRTSDILESFKGAKIFSTLDAASGYWQVPLTEDAISKSAFICNEGLFEFLVMPFGLCNAPATYQRIMNLMLSGLNGISCLVYLDDIIVFSRDFREHLADLQQVFDRLVQAEMLLKPSKCYFGLDRVKYLGHIVSAEGISPDPAKLEKLKTFARPKSVGDVRAFLGFAGYYRRFIRDFAMIASPLFKLLEQDSKFEWNAEQETAFQTLLNTIEAEAVLVHPKFGEPFLVDADASGTGIGGVLSQIIEGKERPIAFVSRHLTKAEQKWHIREQEALAVIWTLESFRHFLMGAEFKVRTDHSSLKWLLDAKNGRLGRWALRLMEFGPFQIVHRSGKMHTNVDALSRQNVPESDTFPDRTLYALEEVFPSREEVIHAQAQDPFCIELLKKALRHEVPFVLEKGVLAVATPRGYRLVLPQSLQERIILLYHNQGHFGIAKTAAKVLEKCHLPRAKSIIADILSRCLPCQQRKKVADSHVSLASRPSSRPWSTVAADFCGPYTSSSEEHRYFLVFVDHFTKWVELIPTRTQEAREVAQAFYDQIICRHGCPRRFLSDRGTSFRAELVDSLCSLFQVRKIFSSSYFPQGDGTAERFMRSLNNSLSIMSRHHPKDWYKFLSGVAFGYNTTVHASTGVSPFFLNTGRVPSFPEEGWCRQWFSRESETLSEKDYEDYLKSLSETIDHAQAHARNNLEVSWTQMARRYKVDTSPIEVGDRVLIRLTDAERSRFPIRKLAPRWSDPYPVVAVLTNGKTFQVQGESSLITVNRERVLKVAAKTRLEDTFPRTSKKPSGGHIGTNEASDDSGDEYWTLAPKTSSSQPAPSDSFEDADGAGSSRGGRREANNQSAKSSRLFTSSSSGVEVVVSLPTSSESLPSNISPVFLE